MYKNLFHHREKAAESFVSEKESKGDDFRHAFRLLKYQNTVVSEFSLLTLELGN